MPGSLSLHGRDPSSCAQLLPPDTGRSELIAACATGLAREYLLAEFGRVLQLGH